MNTFNLGPAILFVPADRPERYAKAYERSDAIIIDLEDAVAPDDRPAARRALAAHLTAMDDATTAKTIVRVNPSNDPDFSEDVTLLNTTSLAYFMVPKSDSRAAFDQVSAALPGVGLIVLCEPAAGVAQAVCNAQRPAVAGLMWGS